LDFVQTTWFTFLEAVVLLAISGILVFVFCRFAEPKEENEQKGTKKEPSEGQKEEKTQREEKSPSEKEMTKEQTRGVYVVGLLAVLVALSLTTKISNSATRLTLDYLIVSFLVYSFLMIFVYADVLTNSVVVLFKVCARIFLLMGLFASIAYIVVLAYEVLTINPFYYSALYIIFVFAIGILYSYEKRRKN
jgi:cation transport ATPase